MWITIWCDLTFVQIFVLIYGSSDFWVSVVLDTGLSMEEKHFIHPCCLCHLAAVALLQRSPNMLNKSQTHHVSVYSSNCGFSASLFLVVSYDVKFVTAE